MAKKVIDTALLAALNPEYEEAVARGEPWAIKHAQLCESINNGEPEGFRRKFDGKHHPWCGTSCPDFPEGCITCALPESPEVARQNREDKKRKRF